MRFSGPVLALVMLAASTAGCGWSPPAAPPRAPSTAGQAPVPMRSPLSSSYCHRIVARHRAGQQPGLPVVLGGGQRRGRVRQPSAGLFFDGVNPIGSPTPDPRPYITVTPQGDHTANVQYQVAPGPGPCLLSDRYRVGAGDHRGRQAHGAGPDTWPLKCCAVVGNRLSAHKCPDHAPTLKEPALDRH